MSRISANNIDRKLIIVSMSMFSGSINSADVHCAADTFLLKEGIDAFLLGFGKSP